MMMANDIDVSNSFDNCYKNLGNITDDGDKTRFC